jgi:hypothetical protein
MSFFEELRETNSIIKKVLILLRPLGIISGDGSNRLNIDVNAVSSVSRVTTVTTVTAVTNLANTGGVNSYVVAKDTARLAYNTGIRNHISFP